MFGLMPLALIEFDLQPKMRLGDTGSDASASDEFRWSSSYFG